MALATFCSREAGLRCLGAVHGDVQLRLIRRLLDAQIGQPGHFAELAEQLVGDLQAGIDVVALPPARRWAPGKPKFRICVTMSAGRK